MRKYQGAGILFVVNEANTGTQCLLGRRRYHPHWGWWSVSGGGLDRADNGSLHDCATREANEEFCRKEGLERTLQEVGSPVAMIPGRPATIVFPGIFHFKTYCYRFETKPALNRWPLLSHEFTEAQWFPVNELPPRTHTGVFHALWHYELVDRPSGFWQTLRSSPGCLASLIARK